MWVDMPSTPDFWERHKRWESQNKYEIKGTLESIQGTEEMIKIISREMKKIFYTKNQLLDNIEKLKQNKKQLLESETC